MKLALACAALAALAGAAAPAQADVSVCPGGVTLVVLGTTVVDQHLDCVVIPTP
jgi:hypothetical protein